MGLDCRFWHATAAGCEHSEGYDYIVACKSVLVKTALDVFKYATEVCGQLCQYNRAGSFSPWGGTILSIIEEV